MRLLGTQTSSRLSLPVRRRFLSTGRLVLAIVAMFALFVTIAPASEAGPPDTQIRPVIFVENGQPAGGTATLLRTDSGIHMRLTTTVGGTMYNLPFEAPSEFPNGVGETWTVGDATTNWFVVFNNPDGCIGGCGEDEVLLGIPPLCGCDDGGPAGVSVHYAAGHVAGSGSWHSAGSLQEGDTSGMLFGLPLQDAKTAEVHVIVRSHGPASNLSQAGLLGAALNSVDGGCIVEGGPNTCGDAQAAIFNPPTE